MLEKSAHNLRTSIASVLDLFCSLCAFPLPKAYFVIQLEDPPDHVSTAFKIFAAPSYPFLTMSEPAVIAYPVESPNNRRTSSNNSYMDENVYASSLGDSKFADDTIEMSGNFFSQVRFTSSYHFDLRLNLTHTYIFVYCSLIL